MLKKHFFNRDACRVAKSLLGKVIYVKHQQCWISAMIIETEAYYANEKASHASLGFTEKRKALFLSPGTIYMYYARGGDSLNISCRGRGNAVLIKSGYPYFEKHHHQMLTIMQQLNPHKYKQTPRNPDHLCSGQTLLCRSLGLKVRDWDQKQFDKNTFYILDIDWHPKSIIQTKRLGIPKGRDGHLPYRFVDYEHARHCSNNPLTKRVWKEGRDYFIINN